MDEMKNVFFKPWVGKDFEKGIDGKKILVLGESHICNGCNNCGDLLSDSCRNFTKVMFDEYFKYKAGKLPFRYWYNTFTKFANIFSNRRLCRENVSKFWNSVMFYNFVQFSTSYTIYHIRWYQ